MPFDVRCPSCKAKMRFEDDEVPKRGTPIDCPKCNQAFPAPSATAFEEKKPDAPATAEEPKKKQKKPKVYEAEPRTFFNHWLLLLIVGGLMSILITVLTVVWVIVARAAKAEDMVACVPDSYNVIRGVNLKALRNYPGVKANGDKYYNDEAKAIFTEVAAKLGLDKEYDLAYFVSAREAGTQNVIYLFGTTPYFDPAGLGNGNPVPLAQRGFSAVCPTRNLIIAASGSNPNGVLMAAGNNAKSKPRDGTHTKLGTTGKLATRGQIWLVVRCEGSLKGWMQAAATEIKDDGPLGKLRESMGKATVFASWVSFGSSGVKVGAGLELGDSSEAYALITDMKKGPLGKADESEPPNNIKQKLSQVMNVSQNGAFWQYLEYKQTGSCAFITSKIEDPDKANQLLNEFINSGRASGGNAVGGGMPRLGP
jgi:predicted Zn finger-like uncharacterized protein